MIYPFLKRRKIKKLVTEYGGISPFSTVADGYEKTSLLETSQFQKPDAAFGLLRRTSVLILQNQIKTERTHPYGRVLSVLAGVAGFEPTNAAVKVLCLTA